MAVFDALIMIRRNNTIDDEELRMQESYQNAIKPKQCPLSDKECEGNENDGGFVNCPNPTCPLIPKAEYVRTHDEPL